MPPFWLQFITTGAGALFARVLSSSACGAAIVKLNKQKMRARELESILIMGKRRDSKGSMLAFSDVVEIKFI
jgi:hypothetical protein